MSDEIRPWTETIARAVAQAATPYVGESLVTVMDQVLARRRAAAEAVTAEVVARTGEDALGHRLADDPEVEALFVQGIEAAVRTGVDSKRRLLARVIGQAVLDDAAVDLAQLYVMALDDLEAPHLRALERLARVVEAVGQPSQQNVSAGNSRVDAVWEAEPAPVRAALVRTGCVALPTGFLISSREVTRLITDFGIGLLADIRRHDVAGQITDEAPAGHQRGARTKTQPGGRAGGGRAEAARTPPENGGAA